MKFKHKQKTEQEIFWTGEFGNNYTKRSSGSHLVAANTVLLAKILSATRGVHSLIEFGPNLGNNLLAIRNIFPKMKLSAVEINKQAVDKLKKIKGLKIYHQSLFEFHSDYQRDLVLLSGILIHLEPKLLNQVYSIIFRTTKKYICLIEYYNPTPVEVTYHNYRQKLFKRDFAGELLDKYPKLRLIDYGFAYHRDNNFDFGDSNWFLLEK